jgi:hypothetical protein
MMPASNPATNPPNAICMETSANSFHPKDRSRSLAATGRGCASRQNEPSDRADHNRNAKISNARSRCRTRRYWLTSVRSEKPLATMIHPSRPCNPPSAKMPTSRQRQRAINRPFTQNQAKGNKNAGTRHRAQSRWMYSHQNIDLNPSRSMVELTSRYSPVPR